MSIAKSLDVDRRSFLASRRSTLFSGTALAGMLSAGVFFAPVAVQPSVAANECNAVGAGSNYIVSCGQGDPDFYTSIVYDNAQTSPADSTLFKFNGTQAIGGGILDRNAVFISSNEDGHTIGIQVLEDGGNVPNFAGSSPTIGDATAFRARTQNNNSALSFEVNGGVFTSGDVDGLGSAHGVALSTSGSNSALDIDLTNVTVSGGDSFLISNVSGFVAETTGPDSGVDFTMNGGTISGGFVAAAGISHGVSISTSDANSAVNFDLQQGTINGGTSNVLASTNGVDIRTGGAGSNITFETGAGSSIIATDGNAVHLVAANADILAGDTINGSLYSGQMIAGVGVGTGYFATAGGDGNTNIHVGLTGDVGGTGAGVIGTTTGTGSVDILVEGHVYQDETAALPLNLLLPVGVGGVAFDDGNVTITTTADSRVSQAGAIPGANIEGAGVLGVAFGDGNVNVTANGEVSATGIGVGGIALGAGNAHVDIGGDVTVDNSVNGGISPLGLAVFGIDELGEGTIGGLAVSGEGEATVHLSGSILGDTAPDIGLAALVLDGSGDATVGLEPRLDGTGPSEVNADIVGLAAINRGSGDAIITEEPSYDPITDSYFHNTVNSDGLGVLGLALTGDVSIETGHVNTGTGGGILGFGGGIAGVALFGGDVDITTYGDTTSEGEFGIFGLSLLGDVDIDLRNRTVTTVNGEGVIAIAGGTVDIEGGESTINSDGNGIFALGNDVYVDSGVINSANGSGVIAVALGGDADVDTHGKITADNGEFGAAAFSLGGNATVTVGGDVDPPAIGAIAATFGPGTATATVLSGNLVEADFIGVAAGNIGTGDVVVNINSNATIDSGEVGIGILNVGGGGDTTVNIASGASVFGDEHAIGMLHLSPDGPAVINNAGLVQGNDPTSAVIAAVTASGLQINNAAGGVIRGDLTASGSPLGAFESIVESIGGATEINNAGEMYGNVTLVDLSGTGNTINNTGYWETGGTSTLVSGTGNDRIVNTGIIDANLFTRFIVDNFDNDGGLLTTTSGTVGDLTMITGNFNGSPALAGSMLAFDAQLAPGGSADLLVVDEDVTGVTLLDVNDLAGGPGQYDPDGVLFAMVGGATDTTNFTTNGGIDKGLFRYDAYLRDTPQNGLGYEEWVLASTLDREAYEFPVLAYGAQNLWYSSTGTWLDRTADLRAGFHGTGETVVDLKNEGASVALPSRTGPGMWARVFGGHHERDMSNTSAAPAGLGGSSYLYEDALRQRHVGFMAGVDYATDGVAHDGHGHSWMFGLMGGYTASDLDFQTSATSAEYKQGSIGGYVSYLHGGFHADLAVKADFGKMDYSFNDGNFSERVDANYRSVGVILDTGYRFDANNGWFVEPKATLAYVHTSFDDMVVLGTGVAIENAKSLRGRLGARVGGSFVSNGSIVEPYVELSVWNEFKGDHVASLGSNGMNVPVGYDTSGTFGEGVVGASLLNMENGWSVYGKGSVQFGGDGMLGYGGNVGFRKSW